MLSVSEPVDNAAQRPPMEEPALWQHKAGGSLVWEDYSQEHGAFLEAARAESKASIELSISCRSIDRSIHRLTYTIDLSKMTQTNAEDPQRVDNALRAVLPVERPGLRYCVPLVEVLDKDPVVLRQILTR